VPKSAILDCFLGNKWQQYRLKKQPNMTPRFYRPRNNWRVGVPATDSETGKEISRFFETKEQAEEFIREHHKAGSVQLADLSIA
jgi:hypothetical protein